MTCSKNPMSYPQIFWDILMKMRTEGTECRIDLPYPSRKKAHAQRSRWFYFRAALVEQERLGFYKGEGTFASSITAALVEHPDGTATLTFCNVANDPNYTKYREIIAAAKAPAPPPNAATTSPTAAPSFVPSDEQLLEQPPDWFKQRYGTKKEGEAK